MSLAGLYNVPSTPQDQASWAFVHAAHHVDIVRLIYQTNNSLVLQSYMLDPFDPNNMDVWLDQHQVMHQQMDAVLGIAGFNLSEVDWQDQNQRAAWISLNAQEHYQAGAKLGLG